MGARTQAQAGGAVLQVVRHRPRLKNEVHLILHSLIAADGKCQPGLQSRSTPGRHRAQAGQGQACGGRKRGPPLRAAAE